MSAIHSDESDMEGGGGEERNLLGGNHRPQPSPHASASSRPRPHSAADLWDPDEDDMTINGNSINQTHKSPIHGYTPTPIHTTHIYPNDSSSYPTASSSSYPPSRVSPHVYPALAAYWFGWSFLWLPLLIVIIPFQVLSLAPQASKGSALGTTLLLGSFVSLFAAPLFGSMSDSSRHKMGRRRPYMLCGLFICSVALLLMSIAPNLSWFSSSFLLLSIGNNMIMAPYAALVPDLIPMDQRGTASGWLGFMSMLGYLFGGMCAYFLENVGPVICYGILGTVHAIGMGITCYFVEEVPGSALDDASTTASGFVSVGTLAPRGCIPRLRSCIAPFHSPDFRILFATRFLMQMGILTVQEYMQYYMQDAIGPIFALNGHVVAASPQKAVSILFLPVLVGAIVSSLGAGVLSDMMGGKRKQIVYASGGLMGFICVLFGLTRSFELCLILGLGFGLGFGAFSTMDWAMATDVLPKPEEFAKDMGIWSLALVLPQVLATPVAGYLLDYFQDLFPGHTIGYTVIFLLSVVYIGFGTYWVKYLETVD